MSWTVPIYVLQIQTAQEGSTGAEKGAHRPAQYHLVRQRWRGDVLNELGLGWAGRNLVVLVTWGSRLAVSAAVMSAASTSARSP
jgi:hypothetical protein